jgi:hypothetical protein
LKSSKAPILERGRSDGSPGEATPVAPRRARLTGTGRRRERTKRVRKVRSRGHPVLQRLNELN